MGKDLTDSSLHEKPIQVKGPVPRTPGHQRQVLVAAYQRNRIDLHTFEIAHRLHHALLTLRIPRRKMLEAQ